ncbi:MAG: hypothetical protein KGL39_52660, partial [Patescibacteria group bacterium]|nr:hypothetical protein [Patescibacteria group bacterium]
QLVQDIATRAEKTMNRRLAAQGRATTGRFAGTAKHSYAKRLLDRYQSMYGTRGLVTEESWLNGSNQNAAGKPGSVRLDVRDTNTNEVYDLDFGRFWQ